jgi:hypothetical protein
VAVDVGGVGVEFDGSQDLGDGGGFAGNPRIKKIREKPET